MGSNISGFYYYLVNCCFNFCKLTNNESKWLLFQKYELSCPVDHTIYIHSIEHNTYELFSLGQMPLYITSSNNCIAHLLDEKIYELCAETLIRNHVIHLHSSFILYQEQAILFTGPSGIGKTTQAELWRDYQGAEIINGDVSLIRKWDGRYCAFGAPIHGSSPYCENKSAPITAVIVLQQGPENRFKSLDGYEALCHCLPEIYRPEMSDETREILFETMDDFFSSVPVYHLTCRPDKDSTELVKKELHLL